MRYLACALAFVLSGCFLDQNPPAPMDGPIGPAYSGVVALSDNSGWGTPEATFWAGFWKVEAAPSRNSRSARLSRHAAKGGRAECSSSISSLEPADQGNLSLVSVGDLSFGPALQDVLDTAKPDSINYYRKVITAGIPAGLYQVVAEGSNDIKKFGDFISVPEAFQEASVNGVIMEEGIPLLHKEPIRVKWRKPAVEHGGNYILLDFLAESETHLHAITCVAKETDLTNQDAFAHWELPQAMVNEFPLTTAAAFRLTRAHVRGAANDQISVEFQGLKTKTTPAVILEQ